MYSFIKYSDAYSDDSFNERVSYAYIFNGERVIASGFNNTSVGTKGEITGSCFKSVKFGDPISDLSPVPNDTSPDPIALDLVYSVEDQNVVLMASSVSDLTVATISLNTVGASFYSVSSSATFIKVGTRPVGAISRATFNNVVSQITVNNTTTEQNYPFKVNYSYSNIQTGGALALQEWPNRTTLHDFSTVYYPTCSIPQRIYNDSLPRTNRIGQVSALTLSIELKDGIKEMIDTLFSPTVDTLFRIVLHPIYTAVSSVYTKSRILFPFASDPIEDLTHIIFSATESVLRSSMHYRVIIGTKDNIVVDGTSTGEYDYGNDLSEMADIKPFTFYYTDGARVRPMGTEQLRFDGEKNPLGGSPKSVARNIIVKLNESLIYRLRDYRNLNIEIYSNDGTRSYHSNLWSN